MKKYYVHKNGFGKYIARFSAIAVEVDFEQNTAVCVTEELEYTHCYIPMYDIRSFIDSGIWIECENPFKKNNPNIPPVEDEIEPTKYDMNEK